MSLEKFIAWVVIALKIYVIYCVVVMSIFIVVFLVYLAMENRHEKKRGGGSPE